MPDQLSLSGLGAFFRAYRLGRGVTLQQAAVGFSAASLSRFERGQADLSAEKAGRVMHALGLEPQDFVSWLTANPTILPFMARPLIEAQAHRELTRRQAAFAAAHEKPSGLTTLAAAWFPAALHWAEPNFHLAAAAEQRLADFLIVPENLTPLEEGMRSALIGPASHELLTLLWARTDRMRTNLRKPYRAVVLIDYWLAAAASGDAAFLRTHAADLEAEFVAYGHLQVYKTALPRWRFAQLLGQWVMAPTTAHTQAVTGYLQASRAEDDHGYAAALWRRAQVAQPSHNPGLVDHFGTLKTSTTAGGVLAKRLKLFGVTAADLPVARDSGTFRRFMQGHTQPGFAAVSQVSAELALLPQTLLTSARVTASGAGHDYGIYSWWSQLTDASDSATALGWYAKFTKAARTLPPTVREAQDFVLQSVLTTRFNQPPQIALGSLAQSQLTRLLQTNQWGTQEALVVLALPAWLPVVDLPPLLTRVRQFCRHHPADPNIDDYHSATAAMLLRLVQAAPATASPVLNQLAAHPHAESAGDWVEFGMVTALRQQLGDGDGLITFAARARQCGQDWALDQLATLLGPRPEFTHPDWPELYSRAGT